MIFLLLGAVGCKVDEAPKMGSAPETSHKTHSVNWHKVVTLAQHQAIVTLVITLTHISKTIKLHVCEF